MGSLFRLNVFVCEALKELLCGLQKNGMNVYAAVPDRGALAVTHADMTKGTAIVIGNEGDGISDEVKNASTSLITVPMKGRAESFNASAAASIVMWEMMR